MYHRRRINIPVVCVIHRELRVGSCEKRHIGITATSIGTIAVEIGDMASTHHNPHPKPHKCS